MSPALSIRGLVKRFRDFTLGPLDLELAAGTVVALVGPNGAGKTTALNCIVGLTTADEGAVEIGGRRPLDPEWKRNVGYVGETPAFFENWSGGKNLEFLSSFYPGWSHARARELAERFALPLGTRARSLSRGDRAKLAIVAALAHSPPLLILDEPTSGLDPVVRADFLDTLWELQDDEERTILYCTHILSDIERLAGELAFLDRGRLLLQAPTDALQESWAQVYFRLTGEAGDLEGVCDARSDGDQHRVVTSEREHTLAQLRAAGAGDIRCFPMGVDEIAVAILRRARPRGELVT